MKDKTRTIRIGDLTPADALQALPEMTERPVSLRTRDDILEQLEITASRLRMRVAPLDTLIMEVRAMDALCKTAFAVIEKDVPDDDDEVTGWTANERGVDPDDAPAARPTVDDGE